MSMTDEEIRLAVGGVAFPMVSKFNRGDLYSTSEKIVGQWVDGKPLYSRTFTNLTFEAFTGVSHCWRAIIVSAEDAATLTLIKADLFRLEKPTDATDAVFGPQIMITGTTDYTMKEINQNWTIAQTSSYGIYINTMRNDAADNIRKCASVTIYYTKTTDSAVNIGTGDDYSTDEQIIGTWLDGKPVYQKTVDCGALPNNTTKSVAHGVSNIDKIVDIKGCAYRSSDGLFITMPRVATSTTYMCEINIISGNVNIISSTNLSAFGWSYVTIQYTKTTD